MASLISPGVSVDIIDESFFIPAAAVTVPLIFIATADEKKQAPAGSSSATAQLDALGTFEYGVIRTVTSLKQSVALYGVPNFLTDSAGNAYHGDVRNEYGLFALNQFLGIGNRAYVVRANVNLNDNAEDIRDMWDVKIQEASYVLENLVNAFINEFNIANGYTTSNPSYKVTVTQTELAALITQATASLWTSFTFKNVQDGFMVDHSAAPYDVYAKGFTQTPTGQFDGMTFILTNWQLLGSGSVVPSEWSPTEAGNILISAADQFKYTTQFANGTSLGANDAARRVAVATALAAAINSNTDIRSETYEYNLILCPGFPEVADEMVNLCADIDYFPGRGLIVWGQKTSAPGASALDRINVVRLMMYIKRQLRKNTMSFVFEPNDQLTRDNLKAVVDNFLGDIMVKRGLYDFVTVCDETNNTADRIDRNEMYIDVALKPVKAAEFVYIPIRVVNTGASR